LVLLDGLFEAVGQRSFVFCVSKVNTMGDSGLDSTTLSHVVVTLGR